MEVRELAAKRLVEQLLKKWDLSYMFSFKLEQMTENAVVLEVTFSKPAQREPIPTDVAVVHFTVTEEERQATDNDVTFVIEHQSHVQKVTSGGKINDVLLDRVLEQKRIVRGVGMFEKKVSS
eukprot:TRINITY_DN3002_c0_g2_i1.p1 TRINITY_DN3002_c0_g2~~TRINITY_DN3002_c0_g2_i1.p1  ORF type:complete len:122 (+),score=18.56 TRINITY_DN3002_c0_g2_i1:89-454(+)